MKDRTASIRLRVLIGLDGRLNVGGLAGLIPKVIGMPSRIPFSSKPSRLGRGRLESGPAML
jgi:hypothetical protein